MNKKLLTILLSVLLPAFLVSAVVYATTSVGDAVSVGTTLTVAGTTTLNGNITLVNAVGDTITITGTPTFGATTTFSEVILLSNGEKIDNATDGTLTFTGNGVFNGSRVVATTGYEYWLQANGDITGTGDATHSAKTFGLGLSLTRPLGTNTASTDMEDALIKGVIQNKATGNTTNYKVKGIIVEAKSRTGTGNAVDQVYGMELSGKLQDSGTTANYVRGAVIRADLDPGTVANTDVKGIRVEVDLDANAPSDSAGVQSYYQSQGAYTTPLAAFQVSALTARSWQYGLVIDANSVGTADIRLSNGNTIGDTINFSATMTENTKPLQISATTDDTTHGVRQGAIYIGLNRESTNALTAWDGNPDAALKIQANNKANNTSARGGVRGIDVNARNRDAGTLSWLNAISATAENSANTIDSAYVAQFNMKNSGVISTSHYGVVIQDQSQGTSPADTVLLKLTTADDWAAASGARASAIQIRTGTSDTGGYTYGLDMNGATIGTAEIRMKGGTVIRTNATSCTGACALGDLCIDTSASPKVLICTVTSGTWVDLK